MCIYCHLQRHSIDRCYKLNGRPSSNQHVSPTKYETLTPTSSIDTRLIILTNDQF